jgi:hypothetical protein
MPRCVDIGLHMCRHKATHVFAKYDATLDKKMHISSLLKGEQFNNCLNHSHQLHGVEPISDFRMGSFRSKNSEIQGYILIVCGDFFFAPALKSALVLTYPPGRGLAKIFEGACSNCL